MRIIHYMLGMRLEAGGVVRALIDLCNGLAGRGHDVTMMTADPTDVPSTWDGSTGHPRCEVVQRNPLKLLSSRSKSRVRELVRGADVIHLHVPWDPICWQMGRLACALGKPYFVTTHGMLDDWSMAQRGTKKRLYMSLLGRSLLEKATAVHNTAQAEQDQAVKWYPRGRSLVIPYLFDMADYSALPGPELAKEKFPDAFDGVPTVMFLSRLHAKKNPETVILAAKVLRDQGTSCRMLIAGSGEPGYDQSLRDLVDRNQLNDHVRFLGFVTGQLKTSLYQAADIFALPTEQENFGFVLVEAIACGTPVITTKGVDIWPELERSGGVVITKQGPEALAQAIHSLLENESQRLKMGARGRAWVHRYLDPQRVMRRYENVYEGAMRGAESSLPALAIPADPQSIGAF
jgi:glycosyltransferase involved in cell wall biosynthesis